MSATSPAVLANFAKMAMRRLRALPDGKGAEIRDLLGFDRWEGIRCVPAESWLELEEMIAFCDAIAAVLGEQGSREFWTALMLDTYDTGLLRPMADDVRARHVGPDASQQLIRLAPAAWGLVTRGCGQIEMVDDGEGSLRLHSGTLLPQVVRSRGIQALFVGACQSMLDQFRARARIEVNVDPATPERIAYTISPI